MRILSLLALCFAAVAAVPFNPQRIVGGSVTGISQYPYVASLSYTLNWSTYTQACGGSILNYRAILTAAHCTIGDAANRWRTRVGSSMANSGGVVHNVTNINNHPSYNPNTLDCDIAILRSANTFTFNNNVRAASIAGANYNLGDNQVVWAVGWGKTSAGGSASEQLRHVQIWTVNQNVCSQRYAELAKAITNNMLCSGWLDVGGRDQCQGDVGSPLFHNSVVVGVGSWGQGCGLARFPGVNTRVNRFANWITSNA